MKRYKICPGVPRAFGIDGENFNGKKLSGKAVRVKCPTCKRRVMSAQRRTDEWCTIVHYIPPHKERHWWKKKGVKR